MDEFHVVIAGRAGDHPGANIYITGPGTKKEAVVTAESTFRREGKFSANIALVVRVVFSGTREDAVEFTERMVRKMDEENGEFEELGSE